MYPSNKLRILSWCSIFTVHFFLSPRISHKPDETLGLQCMPVFHLQLMAVQNSSALVRVNLNETSVDVNNDVQNGGLSQAESLILHSQKLQDDSIINLQVIIGSLCPISTPKIDDGDRCPPGNEEEITEKILQHKESAAGIFCELKSNQGTQASHLMLLKDVVGVVATLGKVDDDNLSRLLSEYLGVETMLAIVCKTYEGVRAIEMYDDECNIDKSSGVHGLGSSLGRCLSDRFSVICLEYLRPFAGKFVLDDPEEVGHFKPKTTQWEVSRWISWICCKHD
ncbi:hypothetical protein K1719_044771 [Acacia pycnantha]|nr:hypothetical protein K1719_044771 [Acacia pycnantha]